MRAVVFIFSGILSLCLLASCNADPSSPGGKLGSKNYYGNYTQGVNSGTAYVYLVATGDTLIDLRYSLDSSPSITLNNVVFKEDGTNYSLYKTDVIGTLTGATTSNFGTLTFQYVTSGSTLSFTGNKIQ